MTTASSWMPLYIGDYLADTMHLNAEEHGAYLLLLMHQWRNGPLPTTGKKLAAIARVHPARWEREVGPVVLPFFDVTEQGLVQKRLLREREKAEAHSNRRAEAGRKGSTARWQTDSNANGNAIPNANAEAVAKTCALQSPLPSKEVREVSSSLPSVAPSRKAEPNGHRLQPDWQPNQADRNEAEALGLNPETVATVFRDYWIAKAGKDGRKLDWSATWRNWCRREAEKLATRRVVPFQQQRKLSNGEMLIRDLGLEPENDLHFVSTRGNA